jgi:hypothetical protein
VARPDLTMEITTLLLKLLLPSEEVASAAIEVEGGPSTEQEVHDRNRLLLTTMGIRWRSSTTKSYCLKTPKVRRKSIRTAGC